MGPIITLTTDFGLGDGYVAAMKGVILTVNPQATIVDVTHQVPPQDVLHGAYILSTAYSFFPKGSIHVAVVDPGVGSARRAVAVAGAGHYFVGPDNGVLSLALESGRVSRPQVSESVEAPLPSGYVAVELTESRFHLPRVSSTFHGRDIFAPVAAHLSEGIPIEELGPGLTMLRRLPVASPTVGEEGVIEGAIVHIDGFGNAITNICREDVSTDQVEVRAGSSTLRGLADSYDVGDGAVALWGSSGCLEIAVKNGNAAAELGLRRGDAIKVKPLR